MHKKQIRMQITGKLQNFTKFHRKFVDFAERLFIVRSMQEQRN